MDPRTTPLDVYVKDVINRDNWEQSRWGVQRPSCGTTACLAGQAVMDAGGKLIFERRSEGLSVATFCTMPGKPMGMPIELVAQDLLGLTPEQANDLFDGDNDYDDMVEIAEEIVTLRNAA